MSKFSNLWRPFRIFYESIVRTAKWLPIIWYDRPWDYSYTLQMLKHKIRFQREHINKYARHTGYKEQCHKMRVAELLLERLTNNDYCTLEWQEFQKNYPSEITECADGRSLWKPSKKPGNVRELNRLIKYEQDMWQQDFKYLSELLRKNIRHWWD